MLCQNDRLKEGKNRAPSQKKAEFLRRTEGRQLSETDLQRLGSESGLILSEVMEFCEEQVQEGQAEWVAAVAKEGNGWRCQRCGETRVEEWPSIYGLAATCPSCAALGALSSLQVLYRSRSGSLAGEHQLKEKDFAQTSKVIRESERVEFSPRWELSVAQKKASQELMDFVAEGKEQEILLWAACGAGKTEVCFPAAAWAMNQGQKVLFAAPRQDVVLDVAPRLKRDFPGLSLSVLTGTSPERFTPARFVLATTHQVLRFYQAFDLIFLDEMDAFPYYGNAVLAWGLHQALKPSGKIVFLTATPSPESLEKVRQKRMGIIHLPARHHRKPLPVPEWIRFAWDFERERISGRDKMVQEADRKDNSKDDRMADRMEKKVHLGIGSEMRKLIAHVLKWEKFSWKERIEELAQAGPVLIFVPKISWVNPLVKQLRKEFPQWEIAGSYSSDPRRRGKIEGLRKLRYRLFVSTSILERGVTVPNAQVIVLEADHEVFDERALVQMAGRVGRTRENPHGSVLFLAKRKTPGIAKAIRWIEEQNQRAREQGLIDN